MPASDEEIVVCYACSAPMNITDVAPYSRVVCPSCNAENRVKKQFGPYTVTRRHAIGGMSSVFVANDGELNREVALKILSEEFSKDEKRITAFEEEARLTASFSHPNVVRVLTTGKAFGRFYIAMELVPGGHFEHIIREKGVVPETQILPLAIQVAEGLKGAQAAGLIHRDVKPGNILLDAEGNAKLVDFGLALVTKGGKAKATEIWATPYYVPPEAIEGGEEDFRSDIYAFGATLYHALAGKPSCDEETMATDVLREAKKRIVPLKKIAPDLLDETCAVIDRAMAYSPANRFSSYDQMIAGLQTALKAANGEVVRDCEGVTKVERRAELRANKRRKTLILAVSITLAVAATVTLILLNRSLDTPSAQGANKLVTVAPVEDADAESPGLIARKYSVARTAIEAGDFSKAEGVFSSILADENVQEPTRTWSGLQAVVAAMMDGRMDRAKKNAAAADEHIAGEPEGLEPGFNLGVRPVLSQISGFGFIDFASLQLGDGSERFMGLFLAGLKNWEHGGLEKAVPFFKAVSSESSIADDAVLSWYRKSARMYLMDYEALTSGVLDVDPETVEGCREAIEELNRQLTILNTQGRARFNIRARQIELAKLEKVLKKAPKPAPEPDRDVMMEIATFAENYQFVEIVDLTSKLKYNPPGSKRRSLRGIAESALVFLTEMESDLQKKPAVINMSLKDGAEIVSIAMTSEGKLVGKLSSGEIRDLQWIDFSTVELIELHRELVKNPASEMERLRRHESAIAFEWLAGDRERALAAAGRLSEENNGFKERWNTLASGLPK